MRYALLIALDLIALTAFALAQSGYVGGIGSGDNIGGLGGGIGFGIVSGTVGAAAPPPPASFLLINTGTILLIQTGSKFEIHG